ncbi:MAG: 2-hydroxyglutaryl-CoA dehydratase [Candidatus Rokubacteria bacterium]|nr:2-hydroxyglutaryl-CoA dehydratase [Candidatus Rokubacteria bacterium]
MLTAGIDVGHESVAVVVVHDDGTLGHATFVIAGEVGAAAALAFEQTLARLGIARDRVHRVFATGIGRENVRLADGHRTPMLSHVRGAHSLFPAARTVIDIGAEGSRVMRCDANGYLTNFALNDKCAAGSGVFLETVADMLDVPLADMGRLSLKASRTVVLTATCAVFAESEIVAEIHRGSSREDILWGVNESIVSRIAATSRRVGIEPDLVLTGGVARNVGVVQALREQLEVDIAVPEHPQIAGALGAALLARDAGRC